MNWEAISASAALALVVVTVVIYLHTRTANKADKLNGQISSDMKELEGKIDGAVDRADMANKSLSSQMGDLRIKVADMGLTIAENYVRREELRDTMSTMNTNIVETKAAIAELRQLLFQRITHE